MSTLVELCAGTASVSLWALGRGRPLCGFMGSKRRWAAILCEALGVAAQVPERVVLVDAGPWGDVWSVLRTAEGRDAVLYYLHDLQAVRDAGGLDAAWERALEPPSEVAGRRVAYFLWLQARSAGTIPVWWSGSRWESPTGSRTEAAHMRGGSALQNRQKQRMPGPPAQAESFERRRQATGGRPKGYGARGIQHPRTIAQRLVALARQPWDRVEVVHGLAQDVAPIPGARVLLDGPYVGCPRYPVLFRRDEQIATARRWADAGAQVLVCEGEPLHELEGWTSRPLPGPKPEWVTASWPVVIEEQLGLFGQEAA
jgi:hypothetical protein